MVEGIYDTAEISVFDCIVWPPHGSVARRSVGGVLERGYHYLIDYQFTRIFDRF